MTTQHTDPIPAREAAFAEWLRDALLAAIPADGTAITRNDARLAILDRHDRPRGMTTGDVLRGLDRLIDTGEVERIDNIVPTRVRRRRVAPTLDASRLRAIAQDRIVRLAAATDDARAALVVRMDPNNACAAQYIAEAAAHLAHAEAKELGYRAAVADLLAALEVGA